MLRVETDVEIGRSPDEVFSFASEVDKLPLWLVGVIEARKITEGPIRAGTQLEHVLYLLGKRFIARFETTEYKPHERMAFRAISGPVEIKTTLTLESTAGGTRVLLTAEGDPRGFFKIAAPVLVRVVRRQVQVSLETLKDLLDAPRDPLRD
jgi:uncharacterized protein YndB with AHSA1/START domain